MRAMRDGAHRYGIAAAACALVVSGAVPCSAQAGLQLQTEVSTRRVEVGESFQLQLTVQSETGQAGASAPRLSVPAGISMQGPSVGTQQQVSIQGHQIQQRQLYTATWLLSASRAGIFKVGPPSVLIGGNRMEGRAVRIEVVPAGQGGGARRNPRRRTPFDPFDPFDLFNSPHGNPLRGFGLPGGDPDEELLPEVPEEYRVERAPDRTAFLRAVATPMRAVVGEQVTLSIYAYGRRGAFQETNTSEPSKPDFLTYTLLENSQNERIQRVPIGDEVWYAIKIRELALFPIRSGNLTIGPMRMGFAGRGYGGTSAQGLMRESSPLQIAVGEPPLAGRPSGYELGTVGRFTLSGGVEPRQITSGDAVSVSVTLQGTGNLPSRLRTPQQTGIEWLDPTTSEEIEPRDGQIAGTRRFNYVVRIDKPGRIELGNLTLPFWDPQRKAYDVAELALGAVDVAASKNPGAAASAAPASPLYEHIQPRMALGPAAAQRGFVADQPWFWFALAGGPLAVLLVSGGVSLGRRARQSLQARNRDASTVAAQSLREARRAIEAGDVAAAAGAIERALFTAIEAASGLRARAILKERLAGELEAAALPPELAARSAELLRACDELRLPGATASAAADLATEAEGLVSRLPKRARSARQPGYAA